MAPVRRFVGWEPREAIGLHVFVQSVLEHASVPVSIIPISLGAVPRRAGSNSFTWARFAVPELCGYSGQAIFMDGVDMLCKADIAELEALRDPFVAVQVVKHSYETKHPRKYRGTAMECPNLDYDRKNWSSVMIIQAWHKCWRDAGSDLESLQLRFIPDHLIGALPPEWNHLADEQGPNPDAKLLHFTAGIPAFKAHAEVAHADDWFAARDRAMTAAGSSMRAGELDRLILIEYPLETVTDGVTTVDWYPLVATGSPAAAVPLWASFKDTPPSRSEAVRQGLQVGRNQATVTIRWRGDVTSAMRITEYLVTGIVYQIVGGPSMIGRKQWLEMVVERYST